MHSHLISLQSTPLPNMKRFGRQSWRIWPHSPCLVEKMIENGRQQDYLRNDFYFMYETGGVVVWGGN